MWSDKNWLAMSDIWSKILDYIIAMDQGRRREEESDYVTFFHRMFSLM